MSGYQVQTPRFFVGVDNSNVLATQVNLLNSTVNKLQQVLYATGPLSGADVIGKLITFTGAANNFNCGLPTKTQVLDAVSLINKAVMGNQIMNVPVTQRAAYTAPAVGTTWTCYMKNDTSKTITLTNTNLVFQYNSDVIAPGEFAVFKGMITAPNTVVFSRCCEHFTMD